MPIISFACFKSTHEYLPLSSWEGEVSCNCINIFPWKESGNILFDNKRRGQEEMEVNLTRETIPNFSSFWTASSTSKSQRSPNSSLISCSHRLSRSYSTSPQIIFIKGLKLKQVDSKWKIALRSWKNTCLVDFPYSLSMENEMITSFTWAFMQWHIWSR